MTPPRFVYFDHIAAAPVDPRVQDAMLPFLGEEFGNPQSFYSIGVKAKAAVDQARDQVAHLISARPEEIVFTSSGTESNNLALKGLAAAYSDKGRHIVVSIIEHSSVLNVVKTLEKSGYAVDHIPVDRTGRVDPERVGATVRADTVLISVMLANNEVGTVQPVAAIGRLARERGVVLHCDAVAAAGSIPVDVAALQVDALSLAAQNFYGPKGAAALFVRKGVRIRAQMEGGVQENSRRAGTENVPGIVGLGKAAELAAIELPARTDRLLPLRDRLLQELPRRLERVYVSGHPTERLPGHASFCIEFIEGEGMLLSLEDESIAAASVSACTSRTLRESHVLIAMGYDHALAQGSLILTLGIENSGSDIDYFLDRFPPIVERLRRMSPLYARYQKDPAGYDSRQASQAYCEPH